MIRNQKQNYKRLWINLRIVNQISIVITILTDTLKIKKNTISNELASANTLKILKNQDGKNSMDNCSEFTFKCRGIHAIINWMCIPKTRRTICIGQAIRTKPCGKKPFLNMAVVTLKKLTEKNKLLNLSVTWFHNQTSTIILDAVIKSKIYN